MRHHCLRAGATASTTTLPSSVSAPITGIRYRLPVRRPAYSSRTRLPLSRRVHGRPEDRAHDRVAETQQAQRRGHAPIMPSGCRGAPCSVAIGRTDRDRGGSAEPPAAAAARCAARQPARRERCVATVGATACDTVLQAGGGCYACPRPHSRPAVLFLHAARGLRRRLTRGDAWLSPRKSSRS